MDNNHQQSATEKQIEIIAHAVARIETKVDTLTYEVSEHFEKIDGRFDGVDRRLDIAEGMLNRRYEEIDDLRERMHDLNIRVNKFEVA